jgi:hypothetical protein
MKTTLNWYKREANSYSLIGIRQIRQKWGFKGAFLYVALCDTLVTLDNCLLDLKNDKDTYELLCLDLDFKVEDFEKYINDLLKFKLLVELGEFRYTTKEISESLAVAMEERVKAYIRKYKKEPNYVGFNVLTNSSGELSNSSGELSNSSGEGTGELSKVRANYSQREKPEKKEKPQKTEKVEITQLSKIVFNKEFLDDVTDNFSIDEQIVLDYQKSFLKFFKMLKKQWKNQDDFRSHFLNWLKIELEKAKNSPDPTNIGARIDYE